MKGGEDLLQLMTKFASYEPELHLRPRTWFLHLDMERQVIQETGGSKTAADIVHQVMDKAPEEYATKNSIEKTKICDAILKGKTGDNCFKTIKSAFQSGLKDKYYTAKSK